MAISPRVPRKQDVVLYDVFFPIWVQYLIPANFARILGINYLVNALVVRLALGALPAKHTTRSILRYAGFATVLGLAADFVGLWIYDLLVRPHVPRSAAPVNFHLLVIVGVAAVLIFFANLFLSRRLLNLSHRQSLVLALAMAILTAPWLVLLDRSHFPKSLPPGISSLLWWTQHLVNSGPAGPLQTGFFEVYWR